MSDKSICAKCKHFGVRMELQAVHVYDGVRNYPMPVGGYCTHPERVIKNYITGTDAHPDCKDFNASGECVLFEKPVQVEITNHESCSIMTDPTTGNLIGVCASDRDYAPPAAKEKKLMRRFLSYLR